MIYSVLIVSSVIFAAALPRDLLFASMPNGGSDKDAFSGTDIICVDQIGADGKVVDTNTDTCKYPKDSECDDGGPGYEYTACTLGTDTQDCGCRTIEEIPDEDKSILNADGFQTEAINLCAASSTFCEQARMECFCGSPYPEMNERFSGDGDCDDGGQASEYAMCYLGTDCEDCPPRRDADIVADQAARGGQPDEQGQPGDAPDYDYDR